MAPGSYPSSRTVQFLLSLGAAQASQTDEAKSNLRVSFEINDPASVRALNERR